MNVRVIKKLKIHDFDYCGRGDFEVRHYFVIYLSIKSYMRTCR